MWCYCYYLLPYYLRNNTSNYNIVLISVTFTCEKMVGKTSAWICSLKKTSIAKICWTIPTYWFPSAQETIGCYSILPTTRSHCSNCVINYLLKVFLLLFFLSSFRVSLKIYDSIAKSYTAYKRVINRVHAYVRKALHCWYDPQVADLLLPVRNISVEFPTQTSGSQDCGAFVIYYAVKLLIVL